MRFVEFKRFYDVGVFNQRGQWWVYTTRIGANQRDGFVSSPVDYGRPIMCLAHTSRG